MATRTAQALKAEQRTLLEWACARNVSAEIHYEEGEEDKELRTARLRLIAVRGDELEVDRPQHIGHNVTLRTGTELRVYFAREQEFYAFSSRVLRSLENVDLNRQKTITGMVLAVPTSIEREQRRQDYRVSLARYQVLARLHDLAAEEAPAAPRNARRYDGRLVNLSLGGAAVVFKRDHVTDLKPGSRVFITCELPGVEGPLLLPAQARNIRRMHEDELRIVGFAFTDTENLEVRLHLQRISRFLAEEQRAQLRRRTTGK